MAKQILNVGVKNNDKTGDTLRAGGLKIKANFDELYNALSNDGSTISGGDVLKTGSYLDLNNRPALSDVAISGDFYDLENRPDIGIFVGEPPNERGSQGHVAGNMAFSNNNLYVCLADYEQQASASNLVVAVANNYDLQISWNNTITAIVDAFNAGKSVSINPGTDGNWRPITAITRDQVTGRAHVTYSGNQFGATTGITLRVDQPVIWESIPWTPNYGQTFPGLGGGLSELSNGTAVFSLGSDGVLQLPINGDIVDAAGDSVIYKNPSFISSGNTAPGSAVVASTSSVDVNFAMMGTKFKFKDNGNLQVSIGADIVDPSGNSILTGRHVAAPTTSMGNSTHKAGMTSADSQYFYYCSADFDGSTDIWKRVALETGTW